MPRWSVLLVNAFFPHFLNFYILIGYSVSPRSSLKLSYLIRLYKHNKFIVRRAHELPRRYRRPPMAAALLARVPHRAAARTRHRLMTPDGPAASPSRRGHYPAVPTLSTSRHRVAHCAHRVGQHVATIVAFLHTVLRTSIFLASGRLYSSSDHVSHTPAPSFRVGRSHMLWNTVLAGCILAATWRALHPPVRLDVGTSCAPLGELSSPAHRTHILRSSGHESAAHGRTVARATSLSQYNQTIPAFGGDLRLYAETLNITSSINFISIIYSQIIHAVSVGSRRPARPRPPLGCT